MAAVPAGGPSTVNGILFQLIWSLLTLGGFRATGQRLVAGELGEITLILEPSSGGDQQTVSADKRVVTQLKARSTGGTWSLQEVIREVLPDLYLAVDETKPETEYHFVTEGRRGDWAEVEKFFKELPPLPTADDVLGTLREEGQLKFRRTRSTENTRDAFWEPGAYSPRKLFCKIVDTLRERSSIGERPYDETCRKVWLLLRGYRFMGGYTQAALREAVDRWLLARIGSADRLAEKRDTLLLDLARQACAGDAVIKAAEFLSAHGLDGAPLTDWFALTEKARSYLYGSFRRKRVDLSEDARRSFTEGLLDGWTRQTPILILTGDSGCGKTWHGYGALTVAAERGSISLLIDSRGDADRDLDEAANTFWHQIVGRDEAPPFGRLRARLRVLDPNNEDRQITLLVDNVDDVAEAQRLLEADWEGWGVRVLMTCPPNVADAVRSIVGDRGRVVSVPDFTLGELQAYLSEVVGIDWESIPFDVRKTLRRPLLAKLFREIVPSVGWQPRNEYELYERSWDQLRERGVQLLDVDALRRVAGGVLLRGARYPWTAGDLRDGGLDNAAVGRLIAVGWIREATHQTFEVWHDRLLNWCVAEAVVCELRHPTDATEPHAEVVAGLLRDPRAKCGRWLAYVPMDVLWLLTDPESPSSDLSRRMVTAYETALGRRVSEVLHKELLPTLGQRAVEILLERLRAAVESGPSYEVNNILDGLAATGDAKLARRGIDLLTDPTPKVQRAGVRLLIRCPNATALNRLWAIHSEGVRDSSPYLWQHEGNWSLYEDTFAALKACVRLNPDWLEGRVREADPGGVPVHDLAYLVANLSDATVWLRCKQTLMAKVDAKHERSLATCIHTFRDATEQDWLEARVGQKEDMVGPVALRALAVIAPQRTLALLDRLDEGELYMTREWCFAELYLRLPAEVMAHFADRLRTHEKPWQYANVLQGREDLMDSESFDFLLDRFSELLAAAAGSQTPAEIPPGCRFALDLVNTVSRPILLDRLRGRRGASLEEHLTSWLLAVGPQSGSWKEHDKHEGLSALARIGGDGLNRVLDDWLERGDWNARLHAVEMAERRITPKTSQLLTELTRIGDPPDDSQRFALWGYAAAALAVHECWQAVLTYYLRVGLGSLLVVEEHCPDLESPLDDTLLSAVLDQFRGGDLPTPGSVLAIGIAKRADLLPEIRAALRRADPRSDLAAACLVALQWLRDTDPDIVPVVANLLPIHNHQAVNALLVNGTPGAEEALIAEVRGRFDVQLVALLANKTSYREAAIKVLAEASHRPEIRWDSDLAILVARLRPEALRAAADCPQFFAVAEEIAYSHHEMVQVVGQKPAALRIVGERQPDAAFREALSRLRDPRTPDTELYVRLVADLVPDRAASALLEAVLLEPPLKVIYAIGRQLRRVGAMQPVRDWLVDAVPERRLAACQVVGLLEATEDLRREVHARADDPDNRVAKAAALAVEQLSRSQIADELVEAMLVETDRTHRWTMLDALIAVGDPGDNGAPMPWTSAIRPATTPAMAHHVSKQIAKKRKKQEEELDRSDKRTRKYN